MTWIGIRLVMENSPPLPLRAVNPHSLTSCGDIASPFIG